MPSDFVLGRDRVTICLLVLEKSDRNGSSESLGYNLALLTFSQNSRKNLLLWKSLADFLSHLAGIYMYSFAVTCIALLSSIP